MSFKYSLQKLLDIKENEKQMKEAEYASAQKNFEEKATRLYQLLKRKEEVEASYLEKLSKGVSVYEIQQQQNSLFRMKMEINKQMKETDLARAVMNKRQDELILISKDVKKYERMKEIKKEQFILEQKRLEMKEMDEISIQLYANR